MPKTILVVDDDPDLLELMTIKLTKTGYRVLRAADGAAALDTVRARRPDLVVLDYFLPRLKGDEVCREIKSDESLRRVPVLLLSASTAALPPEALKAIPAEGKLTKPFDVSELLHLIAELLTTNGPAKG